MALKIASTRLSRSLRRDIGGQNNLSAIVRSVRKRTPPPRRITTKTARPVTPQFSTFLNGEVGMHRTAAILARGDPGFFDFLKKVGTAATRTVSSVFKRSPIGTAISTAREVFAPQPAPVFRPIPQQRRISPGAVSVITALGPPIIAAGSQALAAQGAGAVQPAGHHLNKSSYFLRSGEFVPARSRWVRNRTRNNANGKALRRAIGRAKGFDNLVKRNRKALRSLARI